MFYTRNEHRENFLRLNSMNKQIQHLNRDLQNNLREMLYWFLNPKSKGLEQTDDRHTVEMISRNIMMGYSLWNPSMEGVENIIEVSELNESDYSLSQDSDYLEPVIELKREAYKRLKSYLLDFMLHGSLATLDYSKGWSDFDTYLIVSKSTIMEPKRLTELRDILIELYPFLIKIDTLQHHGFLICTEFDLQHYPSYYMPVEVIRKAKSFLGSFRHTFKILDSSNDMKNYLNGLIKLLKETGKTGIFKHHKKNGEYLLSDYRNRNNAMYQMKYFLSYYTSLPYIYLGAKGIPCYKKDSFKKIRNDIDPNIWEKIEMISYIRNEWPNRERFPFKGNAIPNWVMKTVGKKYFEDLLEVVEHFHKRLTDTKI